MLRAASCCRAGIVAWALPKRQAERWRQAELVVGTVCKPPKIVKEAVFADQKKRQIGGVCAIFHVLGTN